MKILSLYDGMACGMLAFNGGGGYEVTEYHAYEIDKYAIKVANHNYPQIIQQGDVFGADFSKYKEIDWLIGGSPCTHWSIAQRNNRETTASGLGWELFSQYVRALKEAKPKFFLYENNKSMSKAIRQSIDKAFGFEAILINSSLVSAQNRQRLYWVGERQSDGTYKKIKIEQPEDRGIVLKDILDGKEYIQNKERAGDIAKPIRVGCYPSPDGTIKNSQGMQLYNIDGKSVNMTANGGGLGAKSGLYAMPINMTVGEKSHTIKAQYYKNGVANFVTNGGFSASAVATPADSTETASIYKVVDGQITIKGKAYPIKLPNGYYTIRKLTVSECKRLQTVPEWYDMSVISDSQAYKCLGNGWTVDVIAHIIKSAYDKKESI